MGGSASLFSLSPASATAAVERGGHRLRRRRLAQTRDRLPGRAVVGARRGEQCAPPEPSASATATAGALPSMPFAAAMRSSTSSASARKRTRCARERIVGSRRSGRARAQHEVVARCGLLERLEQAVGGAGVERVGVVHDDDPRSRLVGP
jgi:hypothetical protein